MYSGGLEIEVTEGRTTVQDRMINRWLIWCPHKARSKPGIPPEVSAQRWIVNPIIRVNDAVYESRDNNDGRR